MHQAFLLYTTFADEASARACADMLLESRLVACVNIGAQLSSRFLWQGARGESAEYGALFKTLPALGDAAFVALRDLHPYDQPVLVGWEAFCDKGTWDWLQQELG
jgi:periplasmic divalent cation tolerance protein